MIEISLTFAQILQLILLWWGCIFLYAFLTAAIKTGVEMWKERKK